MNNLKFQKRLAEILQAEKKLLENRILKQYQLLKKENVKSEASNKNLNPVGDSLKVSSILDIITKYRSKKNRDAIKKTKGSIKNNAAAAKNTDSKFRDTKRSFSITKTLGYLIQLYDRLEYIKSKYSNELVMICVNLTNISDFVGGRDAKIVPCVLHQLDLLSLLSKIFPPLVLLLSSAIPEPPSEIKKALDSKQLWHPPDLTREAFNIDPADISVRNPKFRYAVNQSSKSTVESLSFKPDRIKMLIDDDENNKYARYINAKLVTRLSNQSRWGNFWSQILSIYFYKDYQTEANAHRLMTWKTVSDKPRYSKDLVTVQTVAYILNKFNSLPFYISDLGIIQFVDDAADFPTGLLPFFYSMLELFGLEAGFVIDKDLIVDAVCVRVEATYLSFGTTMLEIKNKYRDIYKLVFDKLGKYVRCTYSDDTCANMVVNTYTNFGELFIGDEKIKTQDKLRNLRPKFQQWFNNITKRLDTKDPLSNTETARFIIMNLNAYTNPGIYYKTSLVIEEEKSALPKVLRTIQPPKPIESWIGNEGNIPITYDWESCDPIFAKIYQKFIKIIEQPNVATSMTSTNFEKLFVALLTNKSQGDKVSLDQLGIQDDDRTGVKTIFAKLSNARIIAFLLDGPTFSIMEKFLDALLQEGQCTLRYQNDRRSRIVEIVRNAYQIGYIPNYHFLTLLKKEFREVSVGKQKGGVVDMMSQIYATGSEFIVNMFSDVAGMDTSTQTFIGTLMIRLFAEWIYKERKHMGKYFANTDSIEEISVQVGDLVTQKTSESLGGLLKTLLQIMSKKSEVKYNLKDEIFDKQLTITANFFESGRYDTTAHHTLLILMIILITYDDIKFKFGQGNVNTFMRAFGDDFWAMLQINSHNLPEIEQIVTFVSNRLTKYFNSLGYLVEHEISRYYSDFLQQSAMCGVTVPKPARSSIFCDERQKTATRDPYTIIKVMTEVYLAASQRYYATENLQCMILIVWILLRVILCRFSIAKLLTTRWAHLFLKVEDSNYFLFPLIMPFLPPLSAPGPSFIDLDNTMAFMGPSPTRVPGDIGYIILLNSILSTESKNLLLQYYYYNDKTFDVGLEAGLNLQIYRPSKLIELSRFLSFDILLGLILTKFSRLQRLTETRAELLQDQTYMLASKLQGYSDSGRITKSIQAEAELLNEFQLRIPKDLPYYQQSRRRIEQSIQAVEELGFEASGLDEALPDFLIKYNYGVPKWIIEKFDQLGFIYNFNMNIPLTDAQLNNSSYTLPLLPGYHHGTEADLATRILGTSLQSAGRITKFRTGHNQYVENVRFDLENALRTGRKAYSRGPRAFNLFLDTLGLTRDERIEFEQLFENQGDIAFDYEYSSAFSPAQLFGISGELKHVPKSPDDYREEQISGRSLYTNILRDLYLYLLSYTATLSISLKISKWTEIFYLIPKKEQKDIIFSFRTGNPRVRAIKIEPIERKSKQSHNVRKPQAFDVYPAQVTRGCVRIFSSTMKQYLAFGFILNEFEIVLNKHVWIDLISASIFHRSQYFAQDAVNIISIPFQVGHSLNDDLMILRTVKIMLPRPLLRTFPPLYVHDMTHLEDVIIESKDDIVDTRYVTKPITVNITIPGKRGNAVAISLEKYDALQSYSCGSILVEAGIPKYMLFAMDSKNALFQSIMIE